MNNRDEYAARARTVEVKDITQGEGNREVFRRLRRNDPSFRHVRILNHAYAPPNDYVPKEGEDLGWLGYYMSKNSHLKTLRVHGVSVSDVQLRSFCRQIAANTSLRRISFYGAPNGNGVIPMENITMLCPFFENSCRLMCITLSDGCVADDELEALAPALARASQLRELDISSNPSVTTRGYRVLLPLLQNPDSSLETLDLSSNGVVSDETALNFAEALSGNRTLEMMCLDGNHVTARGWSAFSMLLCNTSNAKTTFLSNHTLQILGYRLGGVIPDDVRGHLEVNRDAGDKEAAMTKILIHHPTLDMKPFFEWEFKVLPLAMGWFERAIALPLICKLRVADAIYADFDAIVGGRKLSAIYRFVREFPEEYVSKCRRPEARKRSQPVQENGGRPLPKLARRP